MTEQRDPEDELIEKVAEYEFDPLGYVEFAYDWGHADLENSPGPRVWQRSVLEELSKHLADPETRYQPFQGAAGSGHGIGKSALIGQVSNWGMSCFTDCKIVMTANTETQLLTKTMPEVGKWFKRAITGHWFKINATSIHSVDRGHEKDWRLDAITWSKNNTEAFAGLHNERKIIIVIYDEASAIDDAVWQVTEGALTDENTIIVWLVFGNPTRNTGRFKECFGKLRHRWKTWQIDSRTVEGTNKVQIQKWIDDYGIDSDFVKVRVRGMFPAASIKQFISIDDVDKAFGKELNPGSYDFAPKIIGVDPAWEGDDEFVISVRQGLHFKILRTFSKNDNDITAAGILAQICKDEEPDAVFIDGGFGTGVVSAGKTLGFDWTIVWFSEASNDEGCLNKRAEMWKLARDWLKAGGAIPADPMLHQELIGPNTVARLDGKIQLESKRDMKERGERSPNRADSLVLTFAHPVQKKPKKKKNYKPLGEGGGPGTGWMGR
jgi:hypothetical protein